MNRRNFLRSTAATSVGLAFASTGSLVAKGAKPANWRTFEVITRVEVLRPAGTTKVWLPALLIGNTPFQKTLSSEFSVEHGTAEIVESKVDALGIITAEFPVDVKRVVTLTSRVATSNYAVDFSAPDIARTKRSCSIFFVQPGCCPQMES